ncbi:MAG: hypothetical protein Q8N23_15445 [Archangium sp.]|nr:hypothetical protein [Archangium sp.]MDP3154068.1 hypothetical protein [Archangium sp.]MDP3570028.1 hypothetical protein [Archangium sp.]
MSRQIDLLCYNRPFMFAFKKWLWCVVVGASAMASAQAPKPSLMPFPLEFKRTPSGFSKDDKESMQREYTRLVRLSGAMVPDFARYDLALKELKRQDCEREDECLVQLAKKAESLYSLYTSVDYTLEGAVVVTGRVLRDDGKVASPTETVKLAKGRDSFKDIAKNALVQLFTQLKIQELPATRPVEKVEPVKDPVFAKDPLKDPPPPPPPLLVEDTGAGQRSAGKGLVIAGGAVAVVGGVLAGVGGAIGYGKNLNGQNVPPGEIDSVITARTLTTVGFVGVGVGALTVVVGAIVWGTAAPAPLTNISVVPLSGGGVVQFGGQF